MNPSTTRTGALPTFRAGRVARNRAIPFNTYNFTGQGRRYNITIWAMQEQRLEVKNRRRALNGLPPRATYAEI